MKHFVMTMLKELQCDSIDSTEFFTEENAPKWLTSEDTVKGSTMDYRWFWNDYVLTLKVGETINTDFRTIKRIE